MRFKTFLTILALLPFGAAAQTLYVEQTEDGYLNMRSGPGTRHEIVRRLSPGDRVDVEETLGSWSYVRLPSGARGWVSGNYLERGEKPAGNVLFVKQTSDGYLNFRAGPGTTHPILRRVYPGDRLIPLRTQGDWIAVRHATGAEGWVHGAYVSR